MSETSDSRKANGKWVGCAAAHSDTAARQQDRESGTQRQGAPKLPRTIRISALLEANCRDAESWDLPDAARRDNSNYLDFFRNDIYPMDEIYVSYGQAPQINPPDKPHR